MTNAASFKSVLESFIASAEFAPAVIASTKAGFGGSACSVELFEDGSHRVLWNNQIGNKYDSPGQILRIPALSESDYEDFSEMAGSDEASEIAKHLVGTDELEEIAQEMRDGL